ncbi:hypothetical protein CONCODRAFT_87298 [Conidiobolus coronatus NRRL 28638]|uniref:Carrier domain-containing protein n=1 Tax=Conidiobolus coronatus (strain ATCC 28846 / CBS 209.66 / NRRL 28638) TaxID=796925 RepID=A0A137NVY8_CONC2|nr:hypothetical protein CONCODRAFT_87298 [Conidiobolus coronatus NRRL 28638]|eukprot:KXN66799.1 hypothetical protein CONCODRAFT_87298 [Conidiobolus coronatus NRRL 28638]
MIQALFDNGITPLSMFGSTETGIILRCIPDKNSEYLIPLTPVKGLKYILKDYGNDLVELIILKDDPCLAYVQDRDQDGNYPTKDLFQVISRDPLLLNYVSRTDDTIIHVNGEKTNPIPMEEKINRCSYIERCAILGTGQQMNALLVQLDLNVVMSSSLPSAISTIKSFVESANESAPSHSHIYEEMIYYLPMDSKKKLPITMKGDLQRSKCAEIFEEEIKELVEKMESGYVSDQDHEFHGISSADGASTESIVKVCLRSSVNKPLGNSNNFFNDGMDSLSAMRFRNLLKSKISGLELKVTDIYDNNTVGKLVKFIEFSKQENRPNAKLLESYQKEVEDYIARYSNLRLEKTSTKQLPTEEFHIVITGANGSLGSFMIKNLVKQSKVSKVYAMIRAEDDNKAKQKLESSFSQRFINISSENATKIAPLAVKLIKRDL